MTGEWTRFEHDSWGIGWKYVRRRMEATTFNKYATDDQMADIRALLTRVHGQSKGVYAIEYDVVDMPLLLVECWVYDDDGRVQFDRDTQEVVCTRREYPLREPLPAWWQPDA